MSQSVHLCGLVPEGAEGLERGSAAAVATFVVVGCWVTCVCVQVVPQQRDCSESPSAQVAFVRPLICVALHVPVQVGTSRAGVATKLALERFLDTF